MMTRGVREGRRVTAIGVGATAVVGMRGTPGELGIGTLEEEMTIRTGRIGRVVGTGEWMMEDWEVVVMPILEKARRASSSKDEEA